MTNANEANVQLVKHTGVMAESSAYGDPHMKHKLCGILGFSSEEMEALKLCLPELSKMAGCIPDLSRLSEMCRGVERRCASVEEVVRRACCPGNILYSQITLDEYSDDTQVNLRTIVGDFGSNFVDQYPVAPGKCIRLEQAARPGYTPTKIAIDFSLANQGTNYLDLSIQFYLGEGGKTKGKPIGPTFRGNQFINKNGTQIHIDFPEYRNCPVDVGSVEKLAVELCVDGGANNLDSAFVTVFYNNKRFYQLCKSDC